MKPIVSNTLQPDETILLSNSDGWFYIRLTEIVYCSSSNSYTEFHLADGQKIVVSRNLGFYDIMLQAFGFFRVHQTYLVNTRHLQRVSMDSGNWFVQLRNGHSVPLALRKKAELIETLEKLSVARDMHGRTEAEEPVVKKQSQSEAKMHVHVNQPAVAMQAAIKP